MATHHVSLRRACPAPQDVDHIARRVLPLKQPDSSAAHPVQSTLVLLPVGTIYHGTPKHYSVGEVQMSYESTLSQASKTGNGGRIFVACGRKPFIPA
jgi:hypothetical protein